MSRAFNGIAATAVVLLAVGCGRPAGMIFAPVTPPRAWPAPPDPPRIRYVGQLSSADDLKPSESGWQQFGFALTGRPPTTALVAPSDVAHEGGRLYVADPGLAAVVLFDFASRRVTVIAQAGASRLDRPTHVALAPGVLFVSDAGAGCIHVFDRAGLYRHTWGAGQIGRPAGVTYCPANERLYVADVARHRILSFSPQGEVLQTFGRRGSNPGELNFPTSLCWHNRLGLLVADTMNFRVQRFDTDGRFLAAFGRKGDAAGDFALPKGVACDRRGHIFVVDAHFENFQTFDDAGRLLMALGTEGQAPGQFWLPAGIHIDAADRIWVADTYNRRVQVFDLIGEQAG